jgi:hypothetical protein
VGAALKHRVFHPFPKPGAKEDAQPSVVRKPQKKFIFSEKNVQKPPNITISIVKRLCFTKTVFCLQKK